MSDQTVALTAYLDNRGVLLDSTYYVVVGGPPGFTANPVRPVSTAITTYGTIETETGGIVADDYTFTVACTTWSQSNTLLATAAKTYPNDVLVFKTVWGWYYTDARIIEGPNEGTMRGDICSSERWNYTLTLRCQHKAF